MKKIIFVVSVFICLISCDSFKSSPEELSLAKDFNNVTIGNKYSLQLPKYLKSTTELNKDASLQYKNDRKQAYAIVIDANIDDFLYTYRELGVYNDSVSVLQNYSEVIIAGMKEAEPQLNLNSKKKVKINGMDAHLHLFEGQPKSVPYEISYILAFVQGEKRLYTISCWSTTEKMKRYKNTYFQIIKSLKELGNEPA